jgi:phosphonoacetaldehyde hydrolase
MDFVFKHSYRGPVKAAILDWAGTTVDFGCMAPAAVFVEVFRRHGVEITVEQARGPMGKHKRVHIAEVAGLEPVARRWQEVYGRPVGEADIDALYRDFIPLQLECLADHADLIPGTLETLRELRRRGLKIGSTTGYNEEMMALLVPEARRRGYEPDAMVCGGQVPAGRPYPWMAYQNAIQLQVYPLEAYVKIGDTLADIAEGLNAGMWTVGVVMTGNELGMTAREVAALEPVVREAKRARAYERMYEAGAHYVVDGIADVPALLDDIEARLARGERP